MASKVEILVVARNQASPELQKVNKELAGIARTAATQGATAGLRQMALGLGGIGLAAVGLITAAKGVSSLATAMVGGNAEFERYEVQFGVLLKSTEKAKQRLKELAEFGAKTPFELPELVRADKVLTAFGLHSEDTAKRFGVSGQQILTTIGDVAAGTGVQFDELAVTFGKFASGATGEAIMRFQEMGIATREEMTKWGLQFNRAGTLLTPARQAFTVLEAHVREKFGGMMDAQSKTLEGMASNLQDWKGMALRTLGEGLFDATKVGLKSLLDYLNRPETLAAIESFGKKMGESIAASVKYIQDNGPTIQAFFMTIGDAARTTGDAIGQFTGAIQKLDVATSGNNKALSALRWVIQNTTVAGMAGKWMAEQFGKAMAENTHEVLDNQKAAEAAAKQHRIDTAELGLKTTGYRAVATATRDAWQAENAAAADRARLHSRFLAQQTLETTALQGRTQAARDTAYAQREAVRGARDYIDKLSGMQRAAFDTKIAQEAVNDALIGSGGMSTATYKVASALKTAIGRVDMFNQRLANIGTERGRVQAEMSAIEEAMATYQPEKIPQRLKDVHAELEKQDRRLARSGGWAVAGLEKQKGKVKELNAEVKKTPDRKTTKLEARTRSAMEAVNNLKQRYDYATRQRTLNVKAYTTPAMAALRRVIDMKVPEKTARVKPDTALARAGIKSINDTPINRKTVVVNADTGKAVGYIRAVIDMRIPSKTVHVYADTSAAVAQINALNRLERGVVTRVGSAQYREHGGPVYAGQPYIVGERRPELFVPQTNGRIVPSVPKDTSGGDLEVLFALVGPEIAAYVRSLAPPPSAAIAHRAQVALSRLAGASV